MTTPDAAERRARAQELLDGYDLDDVGTDLARDVLALTDALRAAEARAVAAEAERDAAVTAHAALAGAVREYRDAVDHACIAEGSEDAGLDAAFSAAEREDDAARAVDALLRGAPGGYVAARVVREYLAALDVLPGDLATINAAIDRERTARTALDAALLAATTTPEESL